MLEMVLILYTCIGHCVSNFSYGIKVVYFYYMLVGKRPLADVWALDTAAKPYEWRKLDPEGEGPPPCM